MSLYITIPNLILDIILLRSAWFIWFKLVTAYCLYWIRWDLHSMEANFTVSWSFFIINIIVIFLEGCLFYGTFLEVSEITSVRFKYLKKGVYAVLTTGLIEITWYLAKLRWESCRGMVPALVAVSPSCLPLPDTF